MGAEGELHFCPRHMVNALTVILHCSDFVYHQNFNLRGTGKIIFRSHCVPAFKSVVMYRPREADRAEGPMGSDRAEGWPIVPRGRGGSDRAEGSRDGRGADIPIRFNIVVAEEGWRFEFEFEPLWVY